jgi:hypothetical protein
VVRGGGEGMRGWGDAEWCPIGFCACLFQRLDGIGGGGDGVGAEEGEGGDAV